MKHRNQITLGILLAGTCLFASQAVAGPDILDGNEDAARTSAAVTTLYDDDLPVITIRNVGGDAVIDPSDEIEDIFSYSSSVTEVIVTIEPPSGDSITVRTLTGPTWVEDTGTGNWEAEFTMPSPGGELTGTFNVAIDGSQGNTNDGQFKIKKQSGG